MFPNSAANAGNAWNVGYCCTGAQANKVDDVQFTRDTSWTMFQKETLP